MPVVDLLLELLAGDGDLLGIHDGDMRRELRLVLAAQPLGDLGRETPEGLALGIHDQPVALNLARFWVVRLHEKQGAGRGPPGGNGSSRQGSTWARGRVGTTPFPATQAAAKTARPAAASASGTEPPPV